MGFKSMPWWRDLLSGIVLQQVAEIFYDHRQDIIAGAVGWRDMQARRLIAPLAPSGVGSAVVGGVDSQA